MSILILFAVIFGVTLAQPGDSRDCDHGNGFVSERQDIYQRPSGYDTGDYNTPHTSYGTPDPVRGPTRRNNYPQDSSEGETNPRPTYSKSHRPAPVYGPPPSRSRVAAAAGIYDDYEDDDIPSAQPSASPRRYNLNYAQREPYYPRYDRYAVRRPSEYRVPVYYAPLIPDGFIPVHSHSPSTTGKPSTTGTQSAPETYQNNDHQHSSVTSSSSSSSAEEENYDDGQVRRQQPTVVVAGTNSPLQNEFKRYLLRKPFRGIRKLFRGSILAKRNKIGLIPSFVQGATSNF